ncbi:MAG: sialate O-acetylesterase [Opitutales bacterium]
MKKLLVYVYILSAFACANAEILMPRVFSDYMVLQREMPVKIWGKAEMNASVKVEFAGQAKEAKADAKGNWALYLDKMPANANNQAMKVYENGKLSKEFKDILVGEVWIAGGQSNMQWVLASSKFIEKGDKRLENPLLRMFTMQIDATSPEPQFDFPSDARWVLSTQDTTNTFSCVGFLFAENLINELNVPVALIHTPVGGSRMIAWLAKEDFVGNSNLEKTIKEFEENLSAYDYDAEIKAYNTQIEALEKENTAEAKRKIKSLENLKKPRKGSIGFYRHEPYLLYNAKIAPLVGFANRGVIWYQGEADAKTMENIKDFSGVFENLIKAWRKYWNYDMPFYAVQLPSYSAPNMDWAETRWQQYLTSTKLDKVAMAITIDTGEEKNIHPKDKLAVGKRLANLALKETYGIDKACYGAKLEKIDYKGNVAELIFDKTLELKGELRGFEVLVDGNWAKPASMKLEGAKVELSASKEISGVRYLWKNWALPDVCLYNSDLPLNSFKNLK